MLSAPDKIYPLPKELTVSIEEVLKAHDYDPTQIVSILLDVQALDERRFVPEPVAYFLAHRLHMPVTIIYDCLCFYAALSPQPRAKYPVQVCQSIACRVNEADSVLSILRKLLGIEVGEVTYDGRFTIETVSCFGACDVAPAVRINGQVYGHLNTPEKITALLNSLE